MAIVNGTDVGFVDMKSNAGGDTTRHMLRDAEARQDVSVLKRAITYKTTDIASKNRFDKSTVIEGIINKAGAIVSNSTWRISDYIPVEPGMVLYASGHSAANFALFDDSLSVVPNTNNWTNPFTVPADVYWIRMTFAVGSINSAYLSTQNAYDDYMHVVPYLNARISEQSDRIADTVRFDAAQALSDAEKEQARQNIGATSAAEIAGYEEAIRDKAWDIGSYNRFDKTNVTVGTISKTGVITGSNTNWRVSDYMPVNPGMILYAYANSAALFAMYDLKRELVPNSDDWSNPFTVPSGVYYIRMTFSLPSIDTAYLSELNGYDDYAPLAPYFHGQIDKLKAYDKAVAKKDVPFSVSGIINKDYGTITDNANYACTPMIPLSGAVTKLQYLLKTINTCAKYAFYDKNGVFLSSGVSESSTLTEESGTITVLPGDAAYIRFCSNISNGYAPYIGAYNLGDILMRGEYVRPDNLTFAEHDDTTNMIDPAACELGYINGNTDGSVHASTTMYCTPFIPLESEKQYYFNSNYLYTGYCAFYNANKERIDGYGASSASSRLTTPFTTPAGTAYGRFTIASESRLANAWLCKTNQMAEKPPAYAEKIPTEFVPERPTDFSGDDICLFNKILCIGDSLTEGFFNENNGSRLVISSRSYPAQLQKITGIEVANLGESGMTSAEWYTTHGNDDLSGYDACIIQLGVNDQLQNVSEADMNAALTNIITKIKTDNAGIKIFVATIIPANGYMTTGMRSRSVMIRDFVDALNDDDVYLVDMWAYGHTDDLLAYDAGHLSAYGYLRLALDYKAYISWIIRNSPNDFRYVQFIGTAYVYNGDTQTRQITY